MNQVPQQGYLILLLVVLIALMVLDINAQVSKPLHLDSRCDIGEDSKRTQWALEYEDILNSRYMGVTGAFLIVDEWDVFIVKENNAGGYPSFTGETIGAIWKLYQWDSDFIPPMKNWLIAILKPKILGMDSQVEIIPEVDICKWEPWNYQKYQNGSQFKRATKAGYWKPTGLGRDILSRTNKEVIGTRKTLNFYEGRGRAAVLTNWVIYQYQYHRSDIASLPSKSPLSLNETISTQMISELEGLCSVSLKEKKDKKTGSYIPTPDEAVAVGFSPEMNYNDVYWDSSEWPGQQHDLRCQGRATILAILLLIFENYQEDPQLPGLLNDIPFTPLDSDWFSDTEQDLTWISHLPVALTIAMEICSYQPPQSPLKGVYGKGPGSSSNTNTQVLQGFCLQAKDRAEYGSVIDLLQNKNPIREFKKDSEVTEKANPNLSSIWNESVE
ncbi:Protein NTM1-like 9 [Vitis vinifera]|uniref:Protein NTM1-like 9 n=1 Tax=Vitis vinifera TaxID=29760 RepID=A0A438HL28_VITVI|nr:Protein NTM1-like 9 [Vitis vinifera]